MTRAQRRVFGKILIITPLKLHFKILHHTFQEMRFNLHLRGFCFAA